MNDYNIRCPYCGSENVGYIERVDFDDMNENCIYECKDCEEGFYVMFSKEIYQVSIAKGMWDAYKTVYDKYN